jgi:hypothetical protein
MRPEPWPAAAAQFRHGARGSRVWRKGSLARIPPPLPPCVALRARTGPARDADATCTGITDVTELGRPVTNQRLA